MKERPFSVFATLAVFTSLFSFVANTHAETFSGVISDEANESNYGIDIQSILSTDSENDSSLYLADSRGRQHVIDCKAKERFEQTVGNETPILMLSKSRFDRSSDGKTAIGFRSKEDCHEIISYLKTYLTDTYYEGDTTVRIYFRRPDQDEAYPYSAIVGALIPIDQGFRPSELAPFSFNPSILTVSQLADERNLSEKGDLSDNSTRKGCSDDCSGIMPIISSNQLETAKESQIMEMGSGGMIKNLLIRFLNWTQKADQEK